MHTLSPLLHCLILPTASPPLPPLSPLLLPPLLPPLLSVIFFGPGYGVTFHPDWYIWSSGTYGSEYVPSSLRLSLLFLWLLLLCLTASLPPCPPISVPPLPYFSPSFYMIWTVSTCTKDQQVDPYQFRTSLTANQYSHRTKILKLDWTKQFSL